MRTKRSVPADSFNYSLFHVDLLNICKETGITFEDISENILFRNENYLSACLNAKALPLKIIIALCDRFGLSVKKYEVRTPMNPKSVSAKADPAKAEIPTVCDSVPLVFNVVFGGKIYTCKTEVFSDLKVVSSTLYHGDELVGRGRGNFHGESVDAIIRSISFGMYNLAMEMKTIK